MHYPIGEDTCPYCDSMNFSNVGGNRMFCRDCGEKWIDDNVDITASEPYSFRED